MEHVEFSKPRLVLAVLTAPQQVFEEVIERRMLGSALVITAIAGLFGFIWKLSDYLRGNGNVYDLARYNPLMSLAYLIVISLGIQLVAKVFSGQGKLSDTVISLGWTNVIGGLSLVILLTEQFTPVIAGLSMVLLAWTLLVRVIAVEKTHNLPIVKAAVASVVGLFPVAALESISLGVARGLHPTINALNTIAGSKPVSDPVYLWGVALLSAVGVYLLLKEIDWKPQLRIPLSAGMFACMALMALWATLLTVARDPIGDMKTGLDAYKSGNYTKAESQFHGILRSFPRDFAATFYLGQSYLASGNYDAANKQFNDMLAGPRPYAVGMDAVRVHSALGAVEYDPRE